MKTLIKSIARVETNLVRDCFIVLAAISVILLTVQVLDMLHLIKWYDWQ